MKDDSLADSSLRATAMRGTRWTALSAVAMTALQTTQLALLARFLSPEEFGIFALLMIPIGIAQIFADAGMGAAIIHKQDITKEHLSSLYWLNAGTGILLFLLIAAFAPVVAHFSGQSAYLYLIPLSAMSLAIVPFGQQFQVLLQKQISFDKIALFEFLGAMAGVAVSVSLAVSGAGVIALVLGTIANSTVRAGLLALQGWRKNPPFLRFRMADVRPHIAFALFTLGERGVQVIGSRMDQAVVGAILGINALGYYNVALNLTLQPLQKLTGIASRVLLPVLARVQNDPERQRHAYLAVVSAFAFIGAPVLFGLAAVAPTFVVIVLGSDWVPAVHVIQLLSFYVLMRLLTYPTATLLFAQGKANWGFYWAAGLVALELPAIAIGGTLGGLEGAALAIIFVELGSKVMNLVLLRNVLGVGPLGYAEAVRGPVILAGAMALAVFGLETVLNPSHAIAPMVLFIAFGAILYGCGALLLLRSNVQEIAELVSPRLGHRIRLQFGG